MDKASTPSLRSSLFHIYGCSLLCIYSANHCWLTQNTLFLKLIFPICLHGVRDGRGHQLILLVKPGSHDMNEVWSATHRTRNGMLKILKNIIIWVSFSTTKLWKRIKQCPSVTGSIQTLNNAKFKPWYTHTHSLSLYRHAHTHTLCKRKIALNTKTPWFTIGAASGGHLRNCYFWRSEISSWLLLMCKSKVVTTDSRSVDTFQSELFKCYTPAFRWKVPTLQP